MKFGLPGITKKQMQEVDRLMIEEYQIPVELMMEHAGLNLARLAVNMTNNKRYTIQIIAGSGNNGGGGLVAARRLVCWGLKTEVFLPKGEESLLDVPMKQLMRLRKIGASIFDGIPLASTSNNSKNLVFDCYIGYGFRNRSNELSNQVFSYLRNQKEVISLDTPSGFDVSTGVDSGKIKPSATLTIAFIKQGLLKAPKDTIGDLYLVDIGVPSILYRKKLGIEWSPPFDLQELEKLKEAFSRDSLQRVSIHKQVDINQTYWRVN
ncbi:MAG: NAD(P)H-hydrate epimerase [Candidatus Heimdallarchaeota archaeon]|nr:MAG: NAD(P)H-hydrate epimerase [Candidatus Heimdallarchaeota archaeon]